MASIVKAENLGKHYTLGGLHPGYATLRESLSNLVAGKRKSAPDALDPARSFWALRDVGFEMNAGETLGIVGRNGAGKSTLLKILCRITKPTTGRARLNGRVGSLLEVGTGFHPDLTGRENVYLNGAILGMSRFEIKRKFDEIVDFSEVERHLDTPVKFYSSGMYVRLAFSVAAHLDTEILIMDEVLAVGDTAFQRKCLDKMHRIRGEGRTIFFVSHNMAAVTRLCRRALYLRDGRIVADGTAQQITAEYLRANSDFAAERVWTNAEAPGDGVVRLLAARAQTERGAIAARFDVREPIAVSITYDVMKRDHVITPRIDVYNEEGVHLFGGHDAGGESDERPRERGEYTSTVTIPGALLSASNLRVQISIVGDSPHETTHVREADALKFAVIDKQAVDAITGDRPGFVAGVVQPALRWTTKRDSQPGETHAAHVAASHDPAPRSTAE